MNLLKIALETKFDISTSIHNKKGKGDLYYERIYINKDSLDQLKPLLKEHIHDSMLYKINEEPISDNIDTNQIIDSTDFGDF